MAALLKKNGCGHNYAAAFVCKKSIFLACRVFRVFFPFTLACFMFFCCAVPFCAADAGEASANAPAGVLYDLKKRGAHIAGIKANFVQEKYVPFLNESIISAGNFNYTAPQDLEWAYTTPSVSTMRYSNGVATLLDADGKPLNSGAASAMISKVMGENILAWVSLDPDFLLRHYNVAVKSDEPLTLELTPQAKTANSIFESISITFNSDRVTANKITLYEPNGGRTDIKFFDIIIK